MGILENKKKKRRVEKGASSSRRTHSSSATGTGHSAVVHHLVTEPTVYRQMIHMIHFPFIPHLGSNLQKDYVSRETWKEWTEEKVQLLKHWKSQKKATMDDQLGMCLVLTSILFAGINL